MADNKQQTDSGIPSPLRSLVRYTTRRLAVHQNVTYGMDFRVGRSVVISSPHGLTFGDWVSVGPRTVIQCDGRIDDFVLIGMNVQISGRDDHALDEVGVPIARSTWAGHRSGSDRDRVHVERDVWIGGGSTILSGITIGEGSVVGAASVVTASIPAFSIAVGNPARVVRSRFPNPDDQHRHRSGLDRLSEELRRTT